MPPSSQPTNPTHGGTAASQPFSILMKTLLPILLIISTFSFEPKEKYIVIKTDIKNLKREDVGVYESKEIYTPGKISYSVTTYGIRKYYTIKK
jgi:hypothetical protein